MSVESSQNFEENKQKYRDLSEMMQDSHLNDSEKEQLEESYYSDCKEIHEEAALACSVLEKELAIYKEFKKLSPENLKKLQVLGWVNDDWERGPTTFAAILALWEKFPAMKAFSLWEKLWEYKKIFVQYETTFNSFGEEAAGEEKKKDIQRKSGAYPDWEFGPSTFKHILKNPLIIRDYFLETQDTIQVVAAEEFQWDERVIDVSELQDQVPQEAENLLNMSKEDFKRVKQEVSKTAEYQNFLKEVKLLGNSQKKNFQYVVWAEIDGFPWPGTYLHYKNSHIRKAWFSISEVADLKKVVSQDGAQEKQLITQVYNLEEEVLDDMPFQIEQGDMLRYDPDYGIITLVKSWGSDTQDFQVTEGIFSTIQEGLDWANADIIFQTLARLDGDPDKKSRYIQELQSYIHDNDAYPEARNIFCSREVQELDTGTVFTLDFRWDDELLQAITAVDVFWDTPYVKRQGDTYIRRFEEWTWEFKSLWWKRLSIISGTSVLVPNAEEIRKIDEKMQLLEEKEEIFSKIKNPWDIIRAWDRETIEKYLVLANASERKIFTENLQTEVIEWRLFSQMRTMFLNDGKIFLEKSWVIAETLTPLILFGDYKELSLNGEKYTGLPSWEYISEWWEVVEDISDLSTMQWISGSERSTEEQQELIDMIHPRLARELGDWIMKNYYKWSKNSCGASVWNALINMWFKWMPRNWRDGYKFEGFLNDRPNQFKKVAVNNPWEVKEWWIIVYGKWARLWTSTRRNFGHVEIRWADGDFYSYYWSSKPAGSSKAARYENKDQYKQDTWFIGYAYYPTQKTV